MRKRPAIVVATAVPALAVASSAWPDHRIVLERFDPRIGNDPTCRIGPAGTGLRAITRLAGSGE